MTQKQIDFSALQSYDDFYDEITKQLNLPDYFGRNLDALYDVLTGAVSLPLQLHFINMSLPQLQAFSDLLKTLKTIDEEREDFSFRYAIQTY